MRLAIVTAFAVLIAWPAFAAAAQCTASSGERRVPLLEFYTSEGCDSCPPAERWVHELRGRGYGPDRVVVLAYHVDYWDHIGWRDPYAQARFSERQRLVNARNAARVIYTPQFMLNGRDYRQRDDFSASLGEITRSPAKAAIGLTLAPGSNRVAVTGNWSGTGADDAREGQAWLALYESGLASDVRAGENRGKRLEHDFVVRDLAGPFSAGALAHTFVLDARWKRSDLGVAAFVQDARSGEALQSLALPLCRS